MSQQHPDPIAEGLQHSGQRLVQIVSAVVGAQQTLARRSHRLKATQQAMDEKAARADAQVRRAALAEARARWVRAHDRKWLGQANLLDVAEAWGAAVPYADGNAGAAFAVRNCEEQLRRLHPHAMSHYDRLRNEGKDAPEAMMQAAPFFSRDPNVRTGHPAPARGELHEGTGAVWAARPHGPDRGEWEEARQEQRAVQIADELRAKLRLHGHEPQPEELRTVLETATNLPAHVITKVVPERPRTRPPRDIEAAGEDFPLSVDEALEMASKQSPESQPARRTPPQAPDRNRRRNL